MNLRDENCRPWPVESKFENSVEYETTCRRDKQQHRGILMLGENQKQSGNGDDHHHHRSSTKRRDFDHDVVEQLRVVGTHPANHGIVECLGRSRPHMTGNFHENPGSKHGDEQPAEQEHADRTSETVNPFG